MTFRSAPHSVLPITFKMFMVFKAFFLTYLRWGIKDNTPVKGNPQKFDTPPHSSTTGIGILSRKSCGSKWRPLFWQICIQSVFVFGNQKPLSVAHCWSLFRQSCSWRSMILILDDLYQIWKPSTYNEQSTPGFKHWVMLLLFTENKVTDTMLPWGTPISCRSESEEVDTTRTLKDLSF